MGKFSAYKLALKSLPVGRHEFEFKPDKAFFVNMDYNEIHDADLNVSLIVDYHNDLYALHFDIKGNVTVLCDRCLDNLMLPIDTTYDINVQYGEDYNDESDNLLVIPNSDSYLNVAYMLFDTIVLAIPVKHVHPLGKCNRQMSALLKKHRAGGLSDEDAEIAEEIIEDIENLEDAAPSDPRWDALKGLNIENN